MAFKSKNQSADAAAPAEEASQEESGGQALREAIESIVVAVILALLFRAFVAEAFVIPTGSMAPTLMGMHKEVWCPHCGCNYRTGASLELPERNSGSLVVGTVCPNCRAETALDLANDANHLTFSGDRILVSKFSYSLGKPSRFDVGVFKNPNNAKQNYIKRIIGLPNETVRISNGNIYIKGKDDTSFQIARKESVRKLLSMSHLVYDTQYQSKLLLDAKWPARWQPWRLGATTPPEDSWKSERSEDGLRASVAANSQTQWLRYFHKWPNDAQWKKAKSGVSLASVSPYQSRPITDDYAYNGYLYTGFKNIFNGDANFKHEIQAGNHDLREMNAIGREYARTGAHWVGDLLIETNIELGEGDGDLSLVIIRAGVRYVCTISASTGEATLAILDGSDSRAFTGEGNSNLSPRGETDVRAGGSYTIRFCNYDDQLRLWVDGYEVEFDAPTTYDSLEYRNKVNDRPYWTPEDPMDAAPLLIGVKGIEATIDHIKVLRDKYYISLSKQSSAFSSDPFNDYTRQFGATTDAQSVALTLSNPTTWDTTALWKSRRTQDYTMEEDQYFPLGDNSPESADARGWPGNHFVHRDYLVGKAVFVFWPHPWNTPVPFTPNIRRMKLIR